MTRDAVITVKVADAPEVQAALREAARALEAITDERDRYRDALRAVATAGPGWDLAGLARDALDAIEQPERDPASSPQEEP